MYMYIYIYIYIYILLTSFLTEYIKLLQTALKLPLFEKFFPFNVKERAEGLFHLWKRS